MNTSERLGITPFRFRIYIPLYNEILLKEEFL